MKLIHLTKIATIASLLALSNISCAADPVKPAPAGQTNPTYGSTTQTPEVDRTEMQTPAAEATASSRTDRRVDTLQPAASFTVSKDGYFTPVNKSGTAFAPCSTDGRGTCEINNKPVIIKGMRTTIITEIVHTGSPTCLLICVRPPGRPERCSYDREVPECAALNK